MNTIRVFGRAYDANNYYRAGPETVQKSAEFLGGGGEEEEKKVY